MKPSSWNLKYLAIRTVLAIVLLATVTVVVRQVWFELYQIPTGSMRPTFREKDHVVVSKAAFGVNKPFTTAHFYFDPSLVKRTDIVVWSGDNIDIPDANTHYMGLFPTKKRYIKRLIGKPGDILYFYGGHIYGIDRDGKDITPEFTAPWMYGLEYVPFSSFEGRLTTATAEGSNLVHQIFLNQMGQPVGRLTFKGYGVLDGEIPVHGEWVVDNPLAQRTEHLGVETYTDFWGMGHYAMARLLTKEQVRELSDINPDTLEDTVLYLELRHNPSLTYPRARFQEGPDGRIRLLVTPHVTVIPLQEHHVARLMDAMYTSRFVVKDGRAALYNVDGVTFGRNSPLMPAVPDGTYEFYRGKAETISWSGKSQRVEKGHPLYRKTPTNVQRLFNLGIELDTNYSPTKANQVDYPSRFAYFRDGDLYVMGVPIILKNEPAMQYYISHELERQKSSPRNRPYIAFIDRGAPVQNGKVNKRLIKALGLKVPEKHYLVLGDNHARSVDSRYFGFIPEENLQGSPSYLLWPAGSRWGAPAQPLMPWATLPRSIVWGAVWLLAALCYGVYFLRSREKL